MGAERETRVRLQVLTPACRSEMLARRLITVCRTPAVGHRFISVGDSVPAVAMDSGFPPTQVNMAERLAGKKTIVVGLPGAFTPT